MNLIKGRQAEVDFSQKARDTQSKLQGWISEVQNGFTGGDPTQQHCMLSSGRPVLVPSPPPSGYTPLCVFLGKAVQFADKTNGSAGDDKIYAYSVFGVRLKNGELPQTLLDSSPEPAVGQGGSPDLTQTFNLSPLYISSVVSNPVGGGYNASHIITLYNSLNTEQNTTDNGQNDLNVSQLRYNGSNTPGNQVGGGAVVQCIELAGGACIPGGTDPERLNSLQVCLTDGSRTARITVTSSFGIGASIKLDYVNC